LAKAITHLAYRCSLSSKNGLSAPCGQG